MSGIVSCSGRGTFTVVFSLHIGVVIVDHLRKPRSGFGGPVGCYLVRRSGSRVWIDVAGLTGPKGVILRVDGIGSLDVADDKTS